MKLQTLGPTMKVLVTAAVFLIMLARVNSVPLELVRLLAFVVNVSLAKCTNYIVCVSVCCVWCGVCVCACTVGMATVEYPRHLS